MLGASIACIGLILLALGLFATNPMGATRLCREAIERARITTVMEQRTPRVPARSAAQKGPR